MRVLLPLVLACCAPLAAAPLPFPEFKVQEIDKTLKVGYGLRIADLNADGKPDIVVADAGRVIWFDNAGGWKLHTIIENAKAGVKSDNVCLDVFDIDHDGKLDIALGADWQPNNTKTGGSLQWLRQGKTIDEWTVHLIAESIPTLHRINFASVTPEGKPLLIVAPLKGTNSTAEKNWSDTPAKLLGYPIPANPTGKWEANVLTDALHVMHNVRPIEIGDRKMLLTASYEGVGALLSGPNGGWTWKHVGSGNQDNPKGSRGSSEAKLIQLTGGQPALAAIEPFHGNQVVVYRLPLYRANEAPPEPQGVRFVIDEQLNAGHALWCADLDNDGIDEIVAGFREPTAGGVGPGINIYKFPADEAELTWEKHVLDEKGIACEDLACADLNGDGKVDVIGVGRATGNIRIYWNQGVPDR